jgi:hypothetical protein
MTIRFFGRAAGIAFLTASATFAFAAPADDYVALMTAIEIDKACVALKYMESSAVRGAAWDALSGTTESGHRADGRLTEEQYDAWKADLDKKASDNAAAAGCTQQAMNYVLPARGKAAERLYKGLVLAFHFDVQTDIFEHVPLDEHMKKSASGYEAYVRQLYGQNFEAFAARQRELAAQELPVKQFNPFGEYGIFDYGSIDPTSSESSWNAQSTARFAINEVQFEVTAEANGFVVRPRELADGRIIPELRRRDSADVLPVVKGPGYQLVKNAEQGLDQLYSITTLMPDGRLRTMFFGQTATTLASPTVRLYVRTEADPPGSNGWSIFDLPGFRNGATAFDATLATGNCLGAACYDFPLEATEAIMAKPEGDFAELFVAFEPGAEPEPISAISLGRERFGNATLLKLAP